MLDDYVSIESVGWIFHIFSCFINTARSTGSVSLSCVILTLFYSISVLLQLSSGGETIVSGYVNIVNSSKVSLIWVTSFNTQWRVLFQSFTLLLHHLFLIQFFKVNPGAPSWYSLRFSASFSDCWDDDSLRTLPWKITPNKTATWTSSMLPMILRSLE